jgi:endonuclease G
MNKRRRTAWFSAANVDGNNRPSIGPRTGDRWYIDPRIARAEQLGQEAFEPGIDRGHLTRREDTAWGPDTETAKASNDDTFHFANCSLQASAFNRGKDRWQGLEQFLLEQHAKKDKRRMMVITGPLFAANDPAYKNDKMNYTVRCPLQFWKVCVLIREADGQPSATAFILGQEEIKDLDGFQEAFDVAATQIKIKDLEKKTGLDFGDLKKHDRFADGTTGVLEGLAGSTTATAEGRVIRSNYDITV